MSQLIFSVGDPREVHVGVDERPAVEHQWSRNLKRWIFPVAVFGSVSTNANSCGTW